MNWIDFRDIPFASGGISNLFLDYVHDFEKVCNYYEGDFKTEDALRKKIEKVQQKPIERQTIVEVLHEQNKWFDCGEQTLHNIELLRQENTFAIVTGQQVGIFTGPIYTIYKAITAIKLAEECNARYPEYKFVPLFWLEGEDHDFEEANNIHLIGKDNKLFKVEYFVDGKPTDRNLGPIGELVFDRYLDAVFDRVDEILLTTEFKNELLASVKTFYKPGVSFSDAFTRFVNFFMEDSGLIFVNSNNPRLKQLLLPVFHKELTEYPKISELVVTQSAELEINYHAQVKAKPINLFMFHKGGRYLIEPRDDGFWLKGTRYRCASEELMHMLVETPQKFSPNVILRPICQDTLLPTVVYVGGPSEIAYFAQFKPVYEYYHLPMPIIYPRASVTILEEKLAHVLEKYQLEIKDFFVDLEIVSRRVAEKVSEIKIEELFGRIGMKMTEMMNELDEHINKLDPTLVGALATSRAKMEYQINHLKEKMIDAQKRKNDIAVRQIEKVATNIYPNFMLQERQLNVLYFMNKYGLDFIRWLQNEIKIDRFGHQVIRL